MRDQQQAKFLEENPSMLHQLPASARPTLGKDEAERGFDLQEVLNFCWREWKFIAVVFTAVLVVGTVYTWRQIPLYTATSQVLLDPRKEKAAGAEAILSDDRLDYAMIDSQMAIIRSTVFLRRVVEKERLVSDPEFGSGPAHGGPTVADQPDTGRAKDDEPIPPDVAMSIEALKGAVSVRGGSQTQFAISYLLSISVTSRDPARAARLANAVADAFVVDKLDARFEAAKRASAWLSDRLVELKNQLRESEEAVAHFRDEHGLIQSGSNITLNQQQLSELNAKLVAARAEAAEKKARVDLLASIQAKGGNIQSLPDIEKLGAMASLHEQEAKISQQEAELLTRYGNTHPLVVNIRAQHHDIARAIAAESQRVATSIKNDYELAKARATALERSLQEVSGQTSIDDATTVRLRELERTAAVNKSLFEDFLQRAKITEEQSKFEAREARVITPALTPGGPSYPPNSRYMMITVLLGLMLGVGGALAKEMLDAGFTTAKQVEDLLQLPVLTSVGRMQKRDRRVDGKVVPLALYPSLKPSSRYGEAVRSLRTGIRMADVDNPPKIIQITSAVPGEGKTTIAISFAASAAAAGVKVLLIDADLRRASASHVLGLDKDKGLVDLLVGQPDAKSLMQLHKEARFWTLPAGSKTQNPPDLLGSERMKSLMEGLRKTFDLIVIDTPPAEPVIDPVVVSQLSDKVVFVIRWGSTTREMVRRSVQRMSGHRKVAGVALNLVNDRRARRYGKHAYANYYGSRRYKQYYVE
jgi:capsular exopolysaccharide synthesis family protein